MLLSLLLVFLLFVGVVWFYLDSSINRIDALPDYEGRPAAGEGTNWLLVGSDSREGLDEERMAELSTGDTGGKRGPQGALHPLAATSQQVLQSRLALLSAGRLVRGGVAAEAERILIYDEVDIFGEALDESPRFRKRGAALEGEMLADAG